MATDAQKLDDSLSEAEDQTDPKRDWYDRSSLKGDFTVMIADQTEEDFLRRCPQNEFCEFIDGVVYLYSQESNMPEPEDDPDDPTKVWYDRSSLEGDFMVMIPNQTVEDYFRRAPQNKICEYIDGIVYMPSPASLWHQFDVFFLSFLLNGFTVRRRFGHLLGGPASLRVSEKRFLEPDLFVVPYNPAGEFQGFFVDPPILLVVEVLSKSTRSLDLKRKVELYRQLGVEEIWFVDDKNDVLIDYRRIDQGYEVERVGTGPLHCRALPGFWIDVSWLWARPQPDVLTCLEAILAGPPA